MKLKILALFIKLHPQAILVIDSFRSRINNRSGTLDYVTLKSFLKSYHPEVWRDYISAEYSLSEELREIIVKIRCWDQMGIHFIVAGEAHYPAKLYPLDDSPFILFYKGNIEALHYPSVGVVGTREPLDKSLNWLEDIFLPSYSNSGLVLVSGGARGIDQKAHAISLRASLPTVVVMPSGLLEVYPSSLKDWTDDIVKLRGCLVSEYFPDQKMHKYLFHQRNRLIAALGGRIVIVEGRKRSGTLLTAQLALNLGKEIAVVPAHPLEDNYSGNLALLEEGAFPLTSRFQLDSFLNGCAKA